MADFEFILTPASKIPPRSVDWLWKNYLARRKITLLAGESGTGKTTLALTWASLISNGGTWPDNSGMAQPGSTLVYSIEDDDDDTHIPRIMAASGNQDKIVFLEGKRFCGTPLPFNPTSDFERLMTYVKQYNHDFSLIIIDPIIIIVKDDANQNNKVRQALQVISELAKQLNCAIIGIAHFTRGSQGRKVLDRVLHSGAFVQVPRIVLNTVRNEDTDECRLIKSKVSNGIPGGGFSYRIEEVTVCGKLHTSRIIVTGPLHGDPNRLIAEAEGTLKDGTKVGDARILLMQLLKDGPRLQSDILNEAQRLGISKTALQTAKQELYIVDFKNEFQGPSWWKLTLGRE